MKTPQEKYDNDPEYHALVNSIEYYVNFCKFTPCELREAVTYACYRYEKRHGHPALNGIPQK